MWALKYHSITCRTGKEYERRQVKLKRSAISCRTNAAETFR
jgi:hypothetical protein